MQEFIGLIGSVCFALSSWPQACLSLRTKTAKGIQWSFLWLWVLGSFFCTIYAVYMGKYVLLPNYIIGGGGALIVLLVKIKEEYLGAEQNND
ncbi:MAG: hypothetical protein E7019_00880 [Alphaproteobacteria bacterium]|nr:hypothetical protein [Alphaproteobacteria bacterium]